MSTLIFGAGAIGQWLGALLRSTGTDVCLHVRPRVAEQLTQIGGVILNGQSPIEMALTSDLEELKGRHFEMVVCTVKTYAVPAAVADMKKSGITFDHLVSFQNGWGTDFHYRQAYPDHPLWVLTTTRSVAVDGPGRLVPSTKGGLAIAPWGSETGSGVPEPLRRVRLPFSILENGRDLKWSKLLLNLIGNATGAITGLVPSRLADHPRLMRQELLLSREAIAVGNALGVHRRDLPDFPVRILSAALERLPVGMVAPFITSRMKRARGEKLPSLFFDLEDPTRPTELDDMNGAVVKEGERLGVPVPRHKALTDLFHQCRRDEELWSNLQADPTRFLEYV